MSATNDVKAEAISRMHTLNLNPDKIIAPFEQNGAVMATSERLKGPDGATKGHRIIEDRGINTVAIMGAVYQISTIKPPQAAKSLLNAIEKQTGHTVYHMVKVELAERDKAGSDEVYFFLTVSGDTNAWENERNCTRQFFVPGYYTRINAPQNFSNLIYVAYHMANCADKNIVILP